jgi:hypothetical protein
MARKLVHPLVYPEGSIAGAQHQGAEVHQRFQRLGQGGGTGSLISLWSCRTRCEQGVGQTFSRCSTAAVSARRRLCNAASSISDSP